MRTCKIMTKIMKNMGSKRVKHKTKNRIGIRHTFLKPFLITLCMVTAAGISGMAAYRWITEPSRPVDDSHVQPAKKNIESGNDRHDAQGEKQGREQYEEKSEERDEEQIEEILTVNEKYADVLNDPEYMAENNIYVKDAASPEEVTLAFAGDILFDDHYAVMARVMQSGGDIADGIEPDLIREMKSVDIMMLNNEFPYSDRGEPLEDKQFTFRAKTTSVAYLNDLGVDIVSLANNHAYDYGETAFLDTIDTLEDAGIVYVGAGHNLQEARRPVYYIINDIKIAIVSATQIERLDNPDTKGATDTSPGVFRCWNGDNLMETIREADENSDFVIAYLHWGTENVEDIDWAQEKQAVEAVEAGADLIIGDHPHCLQQIGVVHGVPVVYSMGNFWFSSKTLDTGMVKVTLNESGMQNCQFVACKQSGSRTKLLHGEEKKRVLDYMQSISGDVYIDEDGYVTW